MPFQQENCDCQVVNVFNMEWLMRTQAKATRISELEQQLEAQQQAAADQAAGPAADQRPPAPSQEAAAQSTDPRPETAGSTDGTSTETAEAAQTARQRRSARIKHEIHAAAAVSFERALAAITEAASASLEEQLAEETGSGQGQVICLLGYWGLSNNNCVVERETAEGVMIAASS